MEEEIPKFELADLDAILSFLPTLSQPDFVFGEWKTPSGQFPHYFFSPETLQFLKALDKLIVVFDWNVWHEEAARYMEHPAALAKADLLTLRKLITTHVRAERFTEGHLAAQYKNGHLVAILEQLKKIREIISYVE
jgi:hypothetical protein